MGYSADQLEDLTIWLARRDRKDVALAQFTQEGVEKIIYSSYQPPEGKAPHDAVTFLIQSLMGYQRILPSHLRNVNVYTSAATGDMAEGMLDMLSDRTGVVQRVNMQKQVDGPKCFEIHERDNRAGKFFKAKEFEQTQDLTRFETSDIDTPDVGIGGNDATPHTGTHTVHRLYMMCAYALLKKHSAQAPNGKYVASILVGSRGKILAWGINTNTINETFHAEVNMIQSYYRLKKKKGQAYSGLPKGSRIYTTLQCCLMCSGMVYEQRDAASPVHVYYGMLDPSQNAKNPALRVHQMESRIDDGQIKPVRLTAQNVQNVGATLNQQYRDGDFGRMDAASFGRHIPVDNILAELARKYKRNTNSSPILNPDGTMKVVNPNVAKAIHHVCLFLCEMGVSLPY